MENGFYFKRNPNQFLVAARSSMLAQLRKSPRSVGNSVELGLWCLSGAGKEEVQMHVSTAIRGQVHPLLVMLKSVECSGWFGIGLEYWIGMLYCEVVV